MTTQTIDDLRNIIITQISETKMDDANLSKLAIALIENQNERDHVESHKAYLDSIVQIFTSYVHLIHSYFSSKYGSGEEFDLGDVCSDHRDDCSEEESGDNV